MDPHPLLRYGPFIFVFGSLVLCSAASKWTFRALSRLRASRIDAKRGLAKTTTNLRRTDRVSVFGTLVADDRGEGSVALEQALDAPRARRIAPTIAIEVQGRTLTIEGPIMVGSSEDELSIGEVRYRRMAFGERVHATGFVDLERGSFRATRAAQDEDEPSTLGDRDDEVARDQETDDARVILHDATLLDWASPFMARSSSLVLTILLVWGGSTLAAHLAVLHASTSSELPGTTLDALVLAHAVPPISKEAKERMTRELDRRFGDRDRWADPRVEGELQLANAIDPNRGRSAERLARMGFRSKAGGLAANHPDEATCRAGLDALAESVRGGAVQALMTECGHFRTDAISNAAFKMGDFMRSAGRESEAIISRLPIEPVGEPDCAAGGYDFPPETEPLCRLLHAEMRRSFKRKLLDGVAMPSALSASWAHAMLVELGDPYDASEAFSIDPVEYLEAPFASVSRFPIAVYLDLRQSSQANLQPAEAAWFRLAIALERSALGRHEDARVLADEAWTQLAIGEGASEDERARAARLALVVAIRAEDEARVSTFAELLGPEDPLHELSKPGAWREAVRSRAFAMGAPAENTTAWLREGFPACEGCRFFDELEHLAWKRDLAQAFDDAELTADLDPILLRFEAVFLNRLLAASLSFSNPPSSNEGLPL